MGPKEQHGNEFPGFPGFSFYLINPSLGTEEVPGNPEEVTGANKHQKKKKNLALSSQERDSLAT